MHRGYFITGTDTDVGKSLITAGLYRAVLKRGLSARAVKPVQSGCLRAADGCLTATDAVLYRQFQQDLPGGRIDVPETFEPACSPHLAARLVGKNLHVKALAEEIAHSQSSDVTLVEGAGGLLVPLNGRETVLDLIRATGFPVILVADNRLGVINHSLLTLTVLQQNHIPVAGLILNHCSPTTEANRFIREDNPGTIEQFGQVPILGSIPFFPEWAPSSPVYLNQVDRVFEPIIERLLS